MAFIRKYDNVLFTVIFLVFAVVNFIFWGDLSLIRKLVTVFAVLAVLHNFEEKVWPGGFFVPLLGKLGLEQKQPNFGNAMLAVSGYWYVLLGAAYIFDKVPIIFILTIALSIFEALNHTASIKMLDMKKPYTPGMITGYLLAALAIYSIVLMNRAGLTEWWHYLVGVLVWPITFACMGFFIMRSYHVSLSEVLQNVKTNVLGK